MCVLALSDYKQHAAAAGYKPAPQLGRYKSLNHTETCLLKKKSCIFLSKHLVVIKKVHTFAPQIRTIRSDNCGCSMV